jgi:hypothetical protein
VPIFDAEYPAIDLVRCCLALWKKCAADVILERVEAGMATGEVTVTEGVATETVETDEVRAIMVEAMIGLAIAVTDQALATVADVQVAVLPSRRLA